MFVSSLLLQAHQGSGLHALLPLMAQLTSDRSFNLPKIREGGES